MATVGVKGLTILETRKCALCLKEYERETESNETISASARIPPDWSAGMLACINV